jgi:hypothetical protein
MSNIQKTLDSLQPYVIGIRYLEGTPLVDVVFKEDNSRVRDKTSAQNLSWMRKMAAYLLKQYKTKGT